MELSQYFKSILEQDRCAVVICNLAHEIIYINPAAVKQYERRGGSSLMGKNLLDCHNAKSQEKIRKVVAWFAESRENNILFTFHNQKQNKDVYMVALREDDGTLIGYYEKHEYRNTERGLKYLVIGAGATGGCIAGFLSDAGKDVTLIARGRNLQAIRENGLKIRKGQQERQIALKVLPEEEYEEKADIIFLCVKGYSLEETYPLIRRAADGHTIVIPILNIYGTGERMTRELPGIRVLNGCIYIAAEVEKPGVLRMGSDIFRIVYGSVDGKKENPLLDIVEQDLREAGITPVYTDQVRRDTLQKYAMVSPMAAVGAFYDINAGGMQKPGEMRERYRACIGEIRSLAEAMGLSFPGDVVQTNLDILDQMAPDCTASMQKDLKKGGQSEIDGLIFEVVRMGHRYGVPVPNYEEIAAKFGYRYESV